MRAIDDRELVARAKAGDRQAFEQLFREHHVRVYNLVSYILGDRGEAEDATQRAFLRAWEQLPRLRDVSAFTAWLNRIAANAAHDVVRERPVRAEACGEVAFELEAKPDETADPHEGLVSHERATAVHRAIASLPEHQRAVVVMHHLEGMAVQEVAEALRVPLGTVLSRLARAREVLRRKLAPYMEQ